MTTRSLDNSGSTQDLAGSVKVDPVGPPSGRSAKLIPFPAPLPPPWAGEDEDAGCWESIGVLAVRMVADFKRPRILVWSAPDAGEDQHPEL